MGNYRADNNHTAAAYAATPGSEFSRKFTQEIKAPPDGQIIPF
jgi:hypothetical protein